MDFSVPREDHCCRRGPASGKNANRWVTSVELFLLQDDGYACVLLRGTRPPIHRSLREGGADWRPLASDCSATITSTRETACCRRAAPPGSIRKGSTPWRMGATTRRWRPEDRCCLPYPRYPVYACPPAVRRDALGNVRGLADQNGTETDRYLLDAGACPEQSEGAAIWATFESVWNFYRYGGAWGYITDTPGAGLIQLGARYYWPAIGRFVQQDPARQGVNWYAYVDDDPVTGTDPRVWTPATRSP